jgi:agmatinase
MAHFDPDAPASENAGIFGLPSTEADAKVVLVPVPWEATVSYGAGAANGPELILRASRQVDLFDLETGKPYEAGIFMLPIPEHIVALDEQAKKDRARVNRASEEVNAYVERAVSAAMAAGKIAGVIGGDHSVAYGAIRAHAAHYRDLGILHLDAHADLRHAYEGFEYSHASIMECVVRQIPEVSRIVQIGIRDVGRDELALIEGSSGRVQTWVDPLIARVRLLGGLWELFKDVVEKLPEHVYLSFDIDGLDPRLCPSTGTPVPGGLDLSEVSILLEQVVESGRRIVGFDLVEVAGTKAGGEWDGNVGARLLYKMIGWTLKSQGVIALDQRSLWERLRQKNATSRIIA